MASSAPTYAASIDDVRQAAARIASFVHRTPVMTCGAINERAGCELFFKCENLQKIGAFKIRGATNLINQLSDEELQHGVVTHSSGNHAQATALAARQRGVEAHIVMPRTAPEIKKAAVREYGGTIYECEPTQQARHDSAAEIRQRTGAVMVPPYDHAHIIAGQGTVALELLEDVSDLDAVIAPVGGGGLMAGTCVTVRAQSPDTVIFGAEPEAAADAAESLRLGERQPSIPSPQTIADGLLTGLGELTWPIIRDHVRAIHTVDDDAIREAMTWINQRMKLVVEPSGAVPLAAILSDSFQQQWIETGAVRRLGVIISGGNTAG